MLRAAVAVLLVLVLAACDSAQPETVSSIPAEPSAPSTTVAAAPATTTNAPPAIPSTLAAFEVTSVELDGSALLVAVADDPEEHRQGLMYLEDLGDLDGMVFVFAEDSSGGFWMKNTLIPLDIAFFTAGGDFVDGFVMEPCSEDPCPSYRPAGAYRYALEMPAGTMPEDVQHIDVDDR